jgi:hypothetical protein
MYVRVFMVDLKEIAFEGRRWMNSAKKRVQFLALILGLLNLLVILPVSC